MVKQLQKTGVPIIYFGTDSATLLPAMKETGADVIGLDWRIPLDEGWPRLDHEAAVQGNLDPVLLFAEWKELKSRAEDILQRAAGRPGHIFNLGHGILPETPVDNVKNLARFVQEYSASGSRSSLRKPKAESQKPRSMNRIAIVGGGISGLAAAFASKNNAVRAPMSSMFFTNPLRAWRSASHRATSMAALSKPVPIPSSPKSPGPPIFAGARFGRSVDRIE